MSYEQKSNSGLEDPLHSAAKTEHLNMVKLLLLKVADSSIKDSTGRLATEGAERHGLSAVATRLRSAMSGQQVAS